MLKYLIVFEYTIFSTSPNKMSIITELHPKDLTQSVIKTICLDHLFIYYSNSSVFEKLKYQLHVTTILNLQYLPSVNCNCKPHE